jgi:hypothetical protein
MFSRSVVTKLLIFPTRLLESEVGSSVFSAFWSFFFPVFEVTLAVLARIVSSSEELAECSRRVPSTLDVDGSPITDAVSGVCGTGVFDPLLPVELGASALTRMRRECSKTSWVMIAWARTRVRV